MHLANQIQHQFIKGGLKARDVMNTRVTAATPRAIGWDLAPSALSGMYSGLPVVDSKRKVIGVVAEFDLLQAIHEGRDFADNQGRGDQSVCQSWARMANLLASLLGRIS